MNRIDRLTAMILMLQAHRVVTAGKIAEHFRISIRTVYRDIAALGEAGVPIIAEAGVGYALMKGYHLPPVMFTEEEAAALSMSEKLSERFGDDSLKSSMQSAMLKVRAALPTDRKDYLGRLGNSIRVEESPPADGKENHLMTLQAAVVKRRCLEISYDTAGKNQISQRVVEPLGVVFYARNWHLIAWCRLREDIRDFRMDRIRSCDTQIETFTGHEDFSLMEYIRYEVNDCDLIPFEIECENQVYDRVIARIPARITRRSNLPDGRVRIEALAYSLEWIAHWTFSLSTDVSVKSPASLRAMVLAKAEALVERYRK